MNEIKKKEGPLNILDLGCGEGYYTYRMKQILGDENTYCGLDISKLAVRMATQYDKSIHWIVGNSKNIPVLRSFYGCYYCNVHCSESGRTC